jgi:hypothetical protein
MDLKQLFFLSFLLFVILFPFFFSKKEVKIAESIELPNFESQSGKFEIFKDKILKEGSFSNASLYNDKNITADRLYIYSFEDNSTFFAVLNYYYLLEKKLVSYDFNFSTPKIVGKGEKLSYKDKVVKADKILYIIKDIDE